jgi:putative FmdB family regulatory protein
MPTYEYRCPAGHDFERFYRKISDADAQVACPECGKIAERRMSLGGFAFKGSGFYLTDYGKNAHRGEAPPKADSGSGEATTPAPAAAGDSGSSSSDSAAPAKKEISTASGEAKPAAPKTATETKPKPAVESKPAKSGGSSTSKDK